MRSSLPKNPQIFEFPYYSTTSQPRASSHKRRCHGVLIKGCCHGVLAVATLASGETSRLPRPQLSPLPKGGEWSSVQFHIAPITHAPWRDAMATSAKPRRDAIATLASGAASILRLPQLSPSPPHYGGAAMPSWPSTDHRAPELQRRHMEMTAEKAGKVLLVADAASLADFPNGAWRHVQ